MVKNLSLSNRSKGDLSFPHGDRQLMGGSAQVLLFMLLLGVKKKNWKKEGKIKRNEKKKKSKD